MKQFFIYLTIILGFGYANYNEGDFISETDQSLTKSTCYAGNGYEVNDDWKLAEKMRKGRFL